MAINLESLNDVQLTELIARAEQRKKQAAMEHLESVREKVLGLLESNGLTLKDVFGSRSKSARSRKTKQRHPQARLRSRTERPKSPG
jgi:hypothetical protein